MYIARRISSRRKRDASVSPPSRIRMRQRASPVARTTAYTEFAIDETAMINADDITTCYRAGKRIYRSAASLRCHRYRDQQAYSATLNARTIITVHALQDSYLCTKNAL